MWKKEDGAGFLWQRHKYNCTAICIYEYLLPETKVKMLTPY